MNKEKKMNEIESKFISIIHKYFPSEMIIGKGYATYGDNKVIFDASLSDENNSFKNSQYFYKNTKKFIHWTSIQNLMSIINYREIRFYNLHKSADVDEYKYAAEKLKITNEDIEYSKKNLYTFSFCESSELNNPVLWKEYGKNYEGVALEFEIVNNQYEWKNFMLSKVYYEIPKKILELKKDLDNFKKQYPISKTHIDLSKLIAFHKRPSFSKESEIRLATYFPFKNDSEYDKYCNTEFIFDKKRSRVTDYFGLKLWVDNSSPFVKDEKTEYDRRLKVNTSYFIEKPQIKITNIYFGRNCGLSIDEFHSFWKILENKIRVKLGYTIDLELNFFE